MPGAGAGGGGHVPPNPTRFSGARGGDTSTGTSPSLYEVDSATHRFIGTRLTGAGPVTN